MNEYKITVTLFGSTQCATIKAPDEEAARLIVLNALVKRIKESMKVELLGTDLDFLMNIFNMK